MDVPFPMASVGTADAELCYIECGEEFSILLGFETVEKAKEFCAANKGHGSLIPVSLKRDRQQFIDKIRPLADAEIPARYVAIDPKTFQDDQMWLTDIESLVKATTDHISVEQYNATWGDDGLEILRQLGVRSSRQGCDPAGE